MQKTIVIVLAFCTALLAGCSKSLEKFAQRQLADVAKPSTGILPPVVNPITQTNRMLRSLPPPKQRIAVAVYKYVDQSGQNKPSANGNSFSKAVTQGATSILVKALQDTGEGSWFMVVERERLGHLLKERDIIAKMRRIYLGETGVNTKALPPLLFAGIILEGGIIGFDSNTVSGGIGARYLGIGGDVQYRQDTVTVYLRAVSTKTGQVLASVVAHKTIVAYGIRGSLFKFVALDKLAEGEAGYSKNEPDQIAVQQAIEKAVLSLIIEGTERGLWMFSNKNRQNALQQDYYIEQFGSEEAQKKLMRRRNRQWRTSSTGKAKPKAGPVKKIAGKQKRKIAAKTVRKKRKYRKRKALVRRVKRRGVKRKLNRKRTTRARRRVTKNSRRRKVVRYRKKPAAKKKQALKVEDLDMDKVRITTHSISGGSALLTMDARKIDLDAVNSDGAIEPETY